MMRRYISRIILGIAVGIFLLGIAGLFALLGFRYAQKQVNTISDSASAVVRGWSVGDISGVRSHVVRIHEASTRLALVLVPVKPFAAFVGYGRDIDDAITLADDTRQVSAEGLAWIDLGVQLQKITTPLSGVSFADIPQGDRVALKAVLEQASRRLPRTQEIFNRTYDHVALIAPRILGGRFALAWGQVKQDAENASRTISEAFDIAQVAGDLAGLSGGDRTYLVALQNPAELRPAGGFVGNYGVLTLSQGDITSLYTRDVYDMPPSTADIASQVPAPLLNYLGTKQWYFRDGNWSPDWATSARTLLQLYTPALGEQLPRFDAVIGVTPQALGRILAVMGPLEAQGVRIDAQSLTETLLNEVGREFENKGIPYEKRKAIINQLLQALVVKFSDVPLAQYRDFVGPMRESLAKKDIQIMSRNPRTQELVKKLGWGGTVSAPPWDVFMVVDANMASLKTDPLVQRSADYQVVARGDGTLVARLTLTYKNNAQFTWKTTRYRSYTRVYVPQGSKLLSIAGNQERDRSLKPGPVQEGDDLGLHTIGFFISVEPQATHRVVIEYALPRTLTTQSYGLTVLHQAGVGERGLTLRFGFGTSGGNWKYPHDVKKVDDPKAFVLRGNVEKDVTLTYHYDGTKNSN